METKNKYHNNTRHHYRISHYFPISCSPIPSVCACLWIVDVLHFLCMDLCQQCSHTNEHASIFSLFTLPLSPSIFPISLLFLSFKLYFPFASFLSVFILNPSFLPWFVLCYSFHFSASKDDASDKTDGKIISVLFT